MFPSPAHSTSPHHSLLTTNFSLPPIPHSLHPHSPHPSPSTPHSYPSTPHSSPSTPHPTSSYCSPLTPPHPLTPSPLHPHPLIPSSMSSSLTPQSSTLHPHTGPPERPREAGGSPLQPGQVLWHLSGAEADLAGQYGRTAPQVRQLL